MFTLRSLNIGLLHPLAPASFHYCLDTLYLYFKQCSYLEQENQIWIPPPSHLPHLSPIKTMNTLVIFVLNSHPTISPALPPHPHPPPIIHTSQHHHPHFTTSSPTPHHPLPLHPHPPHTIYNILTHPTPSTTSSPTPHHLQHPHPPHTIYNILTHPTPSTTSSPTPHHPQHPHPPHITHNILTHPTSLSPIPLPLLH